MNERLVSPPAAPVLVVKTQGSDQTLRAGSQYRVGRDPHSDIVVNDSRVSWRHAVLQVDGNAWVLEDAGSTNGTFLGTRRVGKVEIAQNCVLRLGHPDDGPVMMCTVDRGGSGNTAMSTGMSSVDRRPTSVMRAPTRLLRIGRDPSNDLVVPDLSVSRQHAELRNLGDGRYEIADLGSHNGTFVNGRQIPTRATVTEQDLIGIGRATFRLFGDELREFIDEGDVSLVAQDLTGKQNPQKGPDFLAKNPAFLLVLGPICSFFVEFQATLGQPEPGEIRYAITAALARLPRRTTRRAGR